MWRSVLLGVVLAGVLAGCSRDGASGGLTGGGARPTLSERQTDNSGAREPRKRGWNWPGSDADSSRTSRRLVRCGALRRMAWLGAVVRLETERRWSQSSRFSPTDLFTGPRVWARAVPRLRMRWNTSTNGTSPGCAFRFPRPAAATRPGVFKSCGYVATSRRKQELSSRSAAAGGCPHEQPNSAGHDGEIQVQCERPRPKQVVERHKPPPLGGCPRLVVGVPVGVRDHHSGVTAPAPDSRGSPYVGGRWSSPPLHGAGSRRRSCRSTGFMRRDGATRPQSVPNRPA